MASPFRDAPGAAPSSRPVLLLVNLGTPEAPTAPAVRRFLAQFLHDYRVVELTRWLWCPILHGAILPLRSGPVARKYARVWLPGGSPLMVYSRALADAMQVALPEFEVALAMRYGNPSVPAVLQQLQSQGMEQVLVLPLYPQYSASTSGSVFDAVADEFSSWRRVPAQRFIADYHDDDGWLQALVASVHAHWAAHGRGDKLLLSFHGLPERMVKQGDPYARQCVAGAHALAARLGMADGEWELSYQSRFGREQWLQPATSERMAALGAEGLRRVDVLCPGFAADCLETLEEIAIENAEIFVKAGGGELRYIAALNADVAHVAALAALARRHAQGWLP